MPVLGRCSACCATHYGPFGPMCKESMKVHMEVKEHLSANMACVPGSGFEDRDSEEY